MPRHEKTYRVYRIPKGLVALFLSAALTGLPGAVRGQGAGRDGGRITRYVVVSGDSSNGSWDSRDEPRIKAWHSQYGSHFAWFRQDEHDYLVTDESTLNKIRDAMAPQLEVDRQQSEVNRHQAEVNRMQESVNNHQKDVNLAQAEVNRQQSLVNRRAAEQSDVNALQSEVNGKQQQVNTEQQKVNGEQQVVNKEQSVVSQMQTRASARIKEALQTVFDAARRQGLAREVR
jgi:HSP90 family molecular chaperone